jgi:hypothetical protein
MFRFRILAIVPFVLLSGCASMQHALPDTSWEEFQSEIISQRSEGKLSALQAQLDLWTKYRQMFGEDPVMNGFYAYSVKLMSAVDAGKMSLEEAQVLVDAREREISARKLAEAERRLAYDPYGSPSD